MITFYLPLQVQRAIDYAQEAFPELRDVDRSLINFKIGEMMEIKCCKRYMIIGISRMVWSPVVATLAEHAIVEIHITPSPNAASSAAMPLVAQPHPYTLEKGQSTMSVGSDSAYLYKAKALRACTSSVPS